MSLDDLYELGKCADISEITGDEEALTEVDYLKWSMSFSMMMVRNQANNTKAFMMNFVEYLECIVRMSYDFSPHPVDHKDKPISFDKRWELEPWVKLEGMCKILLVTCCNE